MLVMNSQARQAAIKSATDVWRQGVALTDYAFRAQPSNVSAKRERARWRCELRTSVTESVNNVNVNVVVCRRLSSSVIVCRLSSAPVSLRIIHWPLTD